MKRKIDSFGFCEKKMFFFFCQMHSVYFEVCRYRYEYIIKQRKEKYLPYSGLSASTPFR